MRSPFSPLIPPSRLWILVVVGIVLVTLAGTALAGSLTPSGAVSATMNTLAELYSSLAGTFDSSAVVANANGSLIQHLKYIEASLPSGRPASNSLDFDELVNAMTLDANTTVAMGGNNYAFSGSGNVGIGTTNVDAKLEVSGTASISGTLFANGGCVGCGGVSSNSLDFDELANALTVDANTTITGGAFSLTFDHASVSTNFEVRGTASISGATTLHGISYTWPSADGASQFLKSNGSGVLSWEAVSSGLTVGTTTIASGTTTRILYDNAGVLGEYTISGSGTVVAMATSPVFTTPTLGAATGTSLAVGGSLISGAQISALSATYAYFISKTSGTNGSGGFEVQNDLAGGSYGDLRMQGSAYGGTNYGVSGNNLMVIESLGASSTGLAVGTNTSDPLILGTNNTGRWTLGATGGMVGDTLSLGGALPGSFQLNVQGTAALPTANFGLSGYDTSYYAQITLTGYSGIVTQLWQGGSAAGGTYFGASGSGLAVLNAGANTSGLAVGTGGADPLILGTNNTARLTFGSAGQINLNTNLVAASTGSGTPTFFEVPTLSLMTGADNIVIGKNSGTAITSGTQNLIIGNNAGKNFTIYSNNVLIGHNVGLGNGGTGVMGASNTGVGSGALDNSNNATFQFNTGVGANALGALTTGNNNAAFGSGTSNGAGGTITTGSNNTFLGAAADASSTGISSSIALGSTAIVTANNQMAVGGNGLQITDVYWSEGVTNASPLAVTHNATGGSGTDIVGASFIMAGGKGTGTGVGGDFVVQTSKVLTTGTTLQTLGDRQRVLAKYTTLTESTDTAFASVAVGTGIVTGGFIAYTVEANDATDFQALTGVVPFTIVNKAGTMTLNLGADQQSNAVSAGTLTGTLTLIDAGSGVAQFKMNAVSSLTQTVLRINCQIFKNFGTGAIAAI